MKLTDIKSNPNNPRVIKDDKFQKLVNSIKEFPKMMELRPMVINNDNIVLGGNMRLKALKELNYKDVPDGWVKRADELTEEEQRRFIIADNVGFGEHDWAMLTAEWDTEELSDWGLDIPDFAMGEELEAQEDDYEIPDEIKTDIVLGDLIEIGEHRLLCGDSTCSDTVAKLIDGNKFSIYTDPPYGINLDGDNSKRGAETSLMKGGLKLKSFIDDSISYAVDAFNLTRAFKPIKEVWWGANYYCHSLPQSNNWLVWDKRVEDKMRNTNSDCELAYIIDGHNSVRIYRHLWNGLIKASEKGQKRVHPTQKPIELASYCYNEYEMGNTILDLFGGSGSAMVACHQTKRKCLMMEFDPHYCQVIIDRMKVLDDTLEIKINGEVYNG
jgi:site-specific DNA-methyltransferase (adenine-specific)